MTRTRSLPADGGLLLLMMLLWCAPWVHGQKGRSEVKEGNRQFHAGEYEKARESYRRARERAPGSSVATFNLGDSEYRLEEFPSAEEFFQEAIQSENQEVVAQAHYNLGNSLFREGRIQESIESYKQALRLNPSDQAAKHNLEFALRKQQEQEKEQQNQEQSSPQDQEGQDQQGQDQQGQDQQNQDQQNQDQQGQDQQGQDKGEAGQQPDEQSSQNAANQGESPEQEKDPGESPQEKEGEQQQEDRSAEGQEDQQQEDGTDGRSDSRTAPDRVQGQLTKEEADRLLQAIQEDLQSLRREQLKKLKRSRAEKDW